jgi:hypothetical protein
MQFSDPFLRPPFPPTLPETPAKAWQRELDLPRVVRCDGTVVIGAPKEIKLQEHRVALLPSAVYQLTNLGHRPKKSANPPQKATGRD